MATDGRTQDSIDRILTELQEKTWDQTVSHALNHNFISTRYADTLRAANPYREDAR